MLLIFFKTVTLDLKDFGVRYSSTNQIFNAVIIKFVSWIMITLSLKIQWKQHHILYVMFVYKHNMMR